jgi:cell division protein FtsZ
MSDNFENLKPKIIVVGVGGAGNNAVNNMIRSNLEGVEFVSANTDAQALRESKAGTKIQLGYELTQGLGAGSKPDVGCASAEETLGEIEAHLKGAHMVFITAGMGGGTGTGAAPVIAKAARNAGILTVGVVTKPFMFEGAHRMRTAEAGVKELQKHVDTLIIIPNQNLFRLADTKTTFADAFNMADNVLYSGVRGVTDLMIMPGLVNLDFADVRTVMSEMGKAMMGTGEAEGDNRAVAAAEAAVANPLLDEVSLKGANGVLINITGGMDMTLFEVDEAANYVREQVDKNANIIFGSTFDERLEGKIRVSVVATGIEGEGPLPSRLGQHDRALDTALPQSQLDFDEPLEDAINPLDTEADAVVEDGAVGDTIVETSVKPKAKRSFWEKIGLKKGKAAEPAPDLVLSPNDEDNPGPTSSDDALDDEDDLDTPAFLRQKKK